MMIRIEIYKLEQKYLTNNLKIWRIKSPSFNEAFRAIDRVPFDFAQDSLLTLERDHKVNF